MKLDRVTMCRQVVGSTPVDYARADQGWSIDLVGDFVVMEGRGNKFAVPMTNIASIVPADWDELKGIKPPCKAAPRAVTPAVTTEASIVDRMIESAKDVTKSFEAPLKPQKRKTKELVKCDICGFEAKGNVGILAHKRSRHS